MKANCHQDSTIRLLKRSRYLRHIDESKIRQLATISKRQTLSKGKVLLRQDEPNKAVYIIINGSVSVFIDHEFVYNLCRSGDILGEMSVITGGPSNATIAADRDVDLIEIPSNSLKEIHGNINHELHSALYHWFSSILSDKLYKISQKAKQFEQINRRIQDDLADAKSTQDKIFSSHTHEIDTFPLTLKCEFSNILGGDLYGIFPVDSRHYGILIGDVSGHGTSACIISMMLFNLFMAFSKGMRSSKDVLSEINERSLQFMHQGKFATLFYGIYNTETQRIVYTNAGHHPVFVLRDQRIIKLNNARGIPVGILQSHSQGYQEEWFEFKPGDRLILFTDAVFEAHPSSTQRASNPMINGLNSLIEYLETNWEKSSRQIVDTLFQKKISSSPSGLEDDYTLMMFDQK